MNKPSNPPNCLFGQIRGNTVGSTLSRKLTLSLKRTLLPLLFALGVIVFLPGCVTEDTGLPSYPVSSRGQAMQVFDVEIVSVRRVALRGESSIVGVGAGALGGGIAGSMIGHGSTSALTAVGGALIGGLAGDAVERKVTSSTGVEIMVRTRSGQAWSIVQKDHGENFQRGEWVRMLINGDKRIITR
jgi:outer membrane lipoprotein SlyB